MIYQIILKRKDNNYEEAVGKYFDRQQAEALRDHYNEHEDNTNIYYLVKAVKLPKAKEQVKRGY